MLPRGGQGGPENHQPMWRVMAPCASTAPLPSVNEDAQALRPPGGQQVPPFVHICSHSLNRNLVTVTKTGYTTYSQTRCRGVPRSDGFATIRRTASRFRRTVP